ncbi:MULTISPECIES: DUF3515 domain-containing protein [Streptomyces]|uniref:DUF3515 domain-containing protein n=1 Tax=Streptomyces TaxID=1883 RepID=UPI00131881F2|nr:MULTISPECIES: DUF3515 domain-containing protein [Streptomyces]QGZ53117.1 DUF3515 family protein [Streptomyces sp. QHH-9511]GGU05578.1 hypothetical protein GCM10010272_58480 [Streptomyces lateritius]
MSSHRPFGLPVAAAALALLTAAGCSSTNAKASVPVPSPPAEEAAFCQALAKELPGTVAGLERNDPEPDSELTAGWGDAAIVLRCGVPRPEKMTDPQAQGVSVDGVRWMVERREGDGPRFTSVYREAYIEVTLDERYAHDAAPLVDLAAPVKQTVPCALEPECE